MAADKSHKDPLPASFDSIEELNAFWSTHSSLDYEDDMETVDVDVELSSSRTYCAIEPGILNRLRVRAHNHGLSTEPLINRWLEEKLAAAEVGPTWYLPYTQHDFQGLAIVIRSRVGPSTLVRPLKDLAAAIDPDLPLYRVETMEERLTASYREKKFVATLLSFFGLLGLVLAGIGIYGVMSYLVSQQRRDIGFRMAVGATVSSVLGLILKRGMALAVVGVAIGLLIPAFCACYLPARRATQVDPITVLRAE